MRKRDAIQHTHERLLDVTSAEEAEEVMADHHRILKLHRDPSDSSITEFEKSRRVIQPIQGALGELAYCQTNPFYTAAEAYPSLKNGPWKNPGVCASDLRVGRPERFPVSPRRFLQQLGVNDPSEITLTKLYVASANVIGRDTVLWHVQDL